MKSEKEEAEFVELFEHADKLLKELEAMNLSPAVRARLEEYKRSLTPEALKAEVERRERCRKQWEEQNRGFPPGVTFQGIEIA
ncbi:MAG: hypothetical protein WC654_04125 [Patescibacteria group bacterium]